MVYSAYVGVLLFRRLYKANLCVEQDLVFAAGPLALLHRGVQMVEPSLAALLAEPSRKEVGHIAPLNSLHQRKRKMGTLQKRRVHSRLGQYVLGQGTLRTS